MKKILFLLSLTGFISYAFGQVSTVGINENDFSSYSISTGKMVLTCASFIDLPFASLTDKEPGFLPRLSYLAHDTNTGEYYSRDSSFIPEKIVIPINLPFKEPEKSHRVFDKEFVTESLGLSNLTDTPASKTPQEKYNFYMQKRKTNYTVGFILLGSGSTLFIVSVVNGLNHLFMNDERDGILIITGGAIALISIPFLIAGRSNKRKAYLSLRKEAATISNKSSGYLNYAAISLKLQL